MTSDKKLAVGRHWTMSIKVKMIIQRKKSIKNQDELSSKIGKTRLKSKGGRQYKSHNSWKFLPLIKKGNRKKNKKTVKTFSIQIFAIKLFYIH